MAQAPTISSAASKKLPSSLHQLDGAPPAPQTPKVCSSCGRELIEGLPLPEESPGSASVTEAPTVTTLTSTGLTTTSLTTTTLTTTSTEPAPAASYAELMVKALKEGDQSEFERVYKKLKLKAGAQAKAMKKPAQMPALVKEMVNQAGKVLDRLAWRCMTPVMAAVRMNNLHALELLLQVGANPELGADDYGPPLMHARSARCMQRLLDAGVDVNAHCKVYGTVLSGAIRENLEVKEILVLLKAGANVNQLAESSFFERIWTSLMTHRLHGRWTDAHEKAPIKASALMVAADKGEELIIKLLLEHGADPELKGGALEDTALMIAVAAQHPQAVKALLDGRANVNAMASDGSTPLSLAAGRNNRQIMQMLIDAGAVVDQEDADGMTALMKLARDYVNKTGLLLKDEFNQVVEFLRENGADASRMVKLPAEVNWDLVSDTRGGSRHRSTT